MKKKIREILKLFCILQFLGNSFRKGGGALVCWSLQQKGGEGGDGFDD
jgi:hypothetical protein